MPPATPGAAGRRPAADPAVRESDTVGRFGGDEFLVILADVDGASEASLVAAKMRTAMLADVAGEAVLSASIGIALYPQDALSGVELVECADQAMYRAKAHGRGHVELYDARTIASAPAATPQDSESPRSAALPPTAQWHCSHFTDLRDANEHLVLAVVAAQGLQTKAEDMLVSWLPSEAILVYADSIRLAQVFGNLLDNASKYTQRGGEIGVDLDCSDGTATLRVSDNGIGISTEALPHIFDLFVQETHARAHAGEGLGLGLAIVRALVEAHGGTIVAASPGRGGGSEFVVTLPVLLDDSTDLAVELPRRAA